MMHNEVTQLTISSVVLNGYVLCSLVAVVMSPLLFCSGTTAYVYVRDRWSQRELVRPVSGYYAAPARSPAQTGAPAPLLYSRCMWQLSMCNLSLSAHAQSQFLSYSSRFQY